MKKLLRSRHLQILLAVTVTLAVARLTLGAEKKEARVTRVIRDVRLMAAKAAPRPASLNDSVREGTSVRTGGDSRAELTFTDERITRLGANTIFSFSEGAREIDLSSGAILLAVPKEAGTVRIKTAATTAAITGFTALFEYHAKSWVKFIILEGHGWIALRKFPDQKRELGPGQIITFRADAQKLPEVHDVDLEKLTNGLLFKQFRPLPGWAWQEIQKEIENQQSSPPPSGGFIDPTSHDTLDQRAAAHPTPERTHSPPHESPPGDRNRPRNRP